MNFHPPWFDPRLPARDDGVLRPLLERRARDTPERRFVQFTDGGSWTWAETLAAARRTAATLQGLGVARGDRVLVFAPTGAGLLRAWFGANLLGAVFVPMNTAYRGNILAHAIANAGATVLVGDAALLARLAEISTARLKTVIALGGPPPVLPGLDVLPESALDGDDAALQLGPPPELWDEQSIIFTSGTTGPSKGVLSSYMHLYTTATQTYGYATPEDTILINLPMFHVGGTGAVYCAVVRGAGIALADGFSASGFWDQLRATGATMCAGLIGVMAAFLMKAEPRPDDADNPLRACSLNPATDFMIAFAKRFGFNWRAGYNMTEISCPISTDFNPVLPPGSCGPQRSGVELRIADGNDIEVATGEVGELIVRTDTPWAMSHGYNNDAPATAKAWRNGWFHTGDAFRKDANGFYYFVDRLKDAIRRRGENVSSFEVETEVVAHPDVQDAAAVAVAADESEDEILIVVTPRPGRSIDAAELIRFLAPRMAYFMVPRYVRVMAELPRTSTSKVRKHELRAAGVTPDTFDRVRAGIKVGR